MSSSSKHTIIRSTSELKRADHIYHPTSYGVLYHHAIVVEVVDATRVTVIHQFGDGLNQEASNASVDAVLNQFFGSLSVDDRSKGNQSAGTIRQETIDIGEYLKTDQLWRVNYDPGKCLQPDEVIRRARSKIGESNYNLWSNNCEHFARWCKAGDHWSNQTMWGTVALAAGAFAVGGWALVAAGAGTVVGTLFGSISNENKERRT